MRIAFFAAAAMTLAPVPAAPETDLEAAIRTCAGLRSGTERLVCYDRIAARLASGSDDASALDVAPEAMFGLAADSAGPVPAQPDNRADLSAISARVQTLGQAPDGSLYIHLENGQTWRQLDARNLGLEAGDTVTISRAAFNSFRIATRDNRYGRVRRVQ
jgi:hypothetical protein